MNDTTRALPALPAATTSTLADLTTEPAFRDFYREHFSYAWRAFRRLGMEERDLPDLVQELFWCVHKRRAAFQPERSPRAWLFGIAFRVASDFRRTARNVREVPFEQPERDELAHSPHDSLEQQAKRELVHQALRALPLERRAAVVMYELEGYSVAEISEALGIPTNTVYSRLRVGRDEVTAAVRRIRLQQKDLP